MTDRDAPIRRYADLFRKPEPPLTLEMVEQAVREELTEPLSLLAGTVLRADVVDVAVNGVLERLRQQMGGGSDRG